MLYLCDLRNNQYNIILLIRPVYKALCYIQTAVDGVLDRDGHHISIHIIGFV